MADLSELREWVEHMEQAERDTIQYWREQGNPRAEYACEAARRAYAAMLRRIDERASASNKMEERGS